MTKNKNRMRAHPVFLYVLKGLGFADRFGERFVVHAVEDEAVVFQFVAVFACDFFQAFGDRRVVEFHHFAGFDADEVVVVVAVVNFKDAVVAFKVVAFEDTRPDYGRFIHLAGLFRQGGL